jgi:glutaredoxin
MSFTVYSRHGCPYCDKIKTVLSSVSITKGYPTKYYELGADFTREEFYKEFGEGSTFPQVMYNSEYLGGCVDTVKYLQENNMI